MDSTDRRPRRVKDMIPIFKRIFSTQQIFAKPLMFDVDTRS